MTSALPSFTIFANRSDVEIPSDFAISARFLPAYVGWALHAVIVTRSAPPTSASARSTLFASKYCLFGTRTSMFECQAS